MRNQLNRGLPRRLMYVENKDGVIDGPNARIGWAEFSRSGRTIRYRGRNLQRAIGGGIRGNFFDTATGEEYWVSGVKKRASNVHWAESASVKIDADAVAAYWKLRLS